jgi:hypothetical protein
MVARRGSSATLVPAPTRLVAGAELFERPALVGVVAKREHGAGVRVEQGRRLLVSGRVAACDVARCEDDRISGWLRLARLRKGQRQREDDGG